MRQVAFLEMPRQQRKAHQQAEQIGQRDPLLLEVPRKTRPAGLAAQRAGVVVCRIQAVATGHVGRLATGDKAAASGSSFYYAFLFLPPPRRAVVEGARTLLAQSRERGRLPAIGLTEATETLVCFVLMCLWPQHFAAIAYGFAVGAISKGYETFYDGIVVQAVILGLVLASVWVWAIIVSFSMRMGNVRRRSKTFEREFLKAKEPEPAAPSKGSRAAVPADITSSMISTLPRTGAPTRLPPSPWSLASLRL